MNSITSYQGESTWGFILLPKAHFHRCEISRGAKRFDKCELENEKYHGGKDPSNLCACFIIEKKVIVHFRQLLNRNDFHIVSEYHVEYSVATLQ